MGGLFSIVRLELVKKAWGGIDAEKTSVITSLSYASFTLCHLRYTHLYMTLTLTLMSLTPNLNPDPTPKVTFPRAGDACYISMSLPYTYSDLRADLGTIAGDPNRSRFVRFGTLGKTVAGLDMDLLTISERPEANMDPESHKNLNLQQP